MMLVGRSGIRLSLVYGADEPFYLPLNLEDHLPRQGTCLLVTSSLGFLQAFRLDDLSGLFQPQQFYDCMILCGIRGLEEEIPQGGELHFRIKVNPSECFPVAPS